MSWYTKRFVLELLVLIIYSGSSKQGEGLHWGNNSMLYVLGKALLYYCSVNGKYESLRSHFVNLLKLLLLLRVVHSDLTCYHTMASLSAALSLHSMRFSSLHCVIWCLNLCLLKYRGNQDAIISNSSWWFSALAVICCCASELLLHLT